MVGMKVARMFPMKRYMTRKTNRIASRRVLTTSSIGYHGEWRGVEGINDLHAGGKYRLNSFILARIRLAVFQCVSAGLLPDGEPCRRHAVEIINGIGRSVPSSVLPMSLIRTTDPSGLMWTGMAATLRGLEQAMNDNGSVETLAFDRRYPPN